jgi:hypothetical protein
MFAPMILEHYRFGADFCRQVSGIFRRAFFFGVVEPSSRKVGRLGAKAVFTAVKLGATHSKMPAG